MKKTETSNEYSRLLELYFEGETTLAQEEQLGHYFQKGDILPEHRPYASLFEYNRLEKEKVEKSDCTQSQNDAPLRVRSHPRRNFRFASIAAVIALLLLAGGILLYEKSNSNPFNLTVGGAAVNDQQLAVNIAKTKLNQLNSILDKMNKRTEKAVNAATLPQQLNLLNRFSKVENTDFPKTNSSNK